jgi:hypothetical protein
MTVRLRLVIASALVLAAIGIASAQAQANVVSASCTLPNLTAVNCSTWHSSDVTLRWSWDPGGETGLSPECLTTTFSTDTPPSGAQPTCTVQWGAAGASFQATVKVDKTPPTVTGATPARPPDHDGWYNHPVAFTFSGSDALSGLASCDTVTYSGPDGGAASVAGGCRDVAGNRGVGAFPFAYDSTPPAPAQVATEPANDAVKLTWVAPPDAATVHVARATGTAARPKTIYKGSGHALTDRGLRNGVHYRYTVTVIDPANNATRTTITAVPTASTLRPLDGSSASTPPRLTWRPAKGASYYNVQLLKGGRKILSAWPHGAHLQLPLSWRFRGHHRHLIAGRYTWYVWPGFGPRPAQRYGGLIGHSSFRIAA